MYFSFRRNMHMSVYNVISRGVIESITCPLFLEISILVNLFIHVQCTVQVKCWGRFFGQFFKK